MKLYPFYLFGVLPFYCNNLMCVYEELSKLLCQLISFKVILRIVALWVGFTVGTKSIIAELVIRMCIMHKGHYELISENTAML